MSAVRGLSDEQRWRGFPIGYGSIDRTLTHIAGSEWYYVQRMLGHEVPPYETWAMRAEDPPAFAEIDAAWTKQAGETIAAIGSVRDWDAKVVYRVTNDEGVRMVVTTTADELFTQLAFHEVHHRAQLLNMLRQMGVTLGDLDFNALMYDRRPE